MAKKWELKLYADLRPARSYPTRFQIQSEQSVRRQQQKEFSSGKMSYHFERPQITGAESLEEPISITAPWSGKVLGSQQINPDEYVMEMLHDNGLKSQMVFRGVPAVGPKSVAAGETLGLLSPQARNFYWNLSPAQEAIKR